MKLYTQYTLRYGDAEMGRKGTEGVSSYNRSVIVDNILNTIAAKLDGENFDAAMEALDRGDSVTVDTKTYVIRETEE